MPTENVPPQPRHGIFYYVFWSVVSLIVTIFILGVGCLFVGVGIPSFIAAKNQAQRHRVATNSDDVATTVADSTNQGPSDKALYIQNALELYSFSASYQSTYNGKIAGVSFKLRNNGDRTLAKVEVTIYFPDASGKTIAEESFYPVYTKSFSSDSRPLKPGYIWQLDGNEFYPAKNVPNEWYPPRTHYKITDIEFLNESKQ